jgi:UDPglucose--hexose-1-phosphate uridylyltransferase
VELRHDPVTGRTVIVAPARDARPHTAPALTGGRLTEDGMSEGGTSEGGPTHAEPVAPSVCPFCPGNEYATPPEVARTGGGEANEPGWRVRVVPNLYPIVDGTDPTARTAGAHEVIVLSPDHGRSFGQLDDEQAVEVLVVLRDRARHHLAHGFEYVQVLVNHGRDAGASLAHPHAQLVAIAFVPPSVLDARDRFAAAGHDLVARERVETEDGPLRVLDGPVPAWCPAGSGTPYELRLAHEGASDRFADATDSELRDAAPAVRDALARLARTLGEVPYNLIVRTPATPSGLERWYVDVLPRTSVVAGFELGTGVLVNVVAPESAAARLRAAG